mgnify:CR=1 FL=1
MLATEEGNYYPRTGFPSTCNPSSSRVLARRVRKATQGALETVAHPDCGSRPRQHAGGFLLLRITKYAINTGIYNLSTLSTQRIRINHQIRAPELRVIGPQGENIGVVSLQGALGKALEAGLDLIEISPNAAPPVAKIMDYGKFQYAENKKQKAAKAKAHNTEVKSIQIKIGTSEHDLGLKAKRVGEWLAGGNLVKIDLFLIGRSKYMEFKFLQERLARILKLIPVAYKIADPVRKGMKGLTVVIEKQ